MLELVLRQQELRLRVMVALYEGLTRDPQAFWDVKTLDLRVAPTVQRAVMNEDSPHDRATDFTEQPPSPSEARAAAFYLLERGLCISSTQENPDTERLMLRITAVGIDALEGMVLSGHASATERPIGFRAIEPLTVGMPRVVGVKP